MTMASTTFDVTDDTERRFSSVEMGFLSGMSCDSVGQPMVFAKFSIEGVCGLCLLASTRSRRLELRRGVDPAAGEAGGEDSGCFCGDDLGVRLLRTVTLRIKFVSHSRFGISSTPRASLLSSEASFLMVPFSG